MTPAAPPEALVAAERAYALVQAEPRRALTLAEEAVMLARSTRDAEGLAAALHVVGYARSRLGDPTAPRTMRAAIAVAERSGLTRRAALARRNLALYLAYQGRLRQAVLEIDAAIAGLSGIERARSEVFRTAVYGLAGRARETLPDSAKALTLLRRRGDREWEARLAYNRGATLSELGDYRLARRDLERAHSLYVATGLVAAAADAGIELALLATLEGDPLRSLAALDAIEVGVLTDLSASWLYLSRAETLLALRLLPEAKADLRRFSELALARRSVDSLNKGRLDAARLLLAAGDPPAAAALALAARRSFAARDQRPFAAATSLVSLAAELAAGSVSPARVRSVRRAAQVLSESGWKIEGLRAHVLLARAAAASGAIETARRELRAARPLGRIGTVADRLALCHAKALTLGRADADRCLARGLALLEQHRATLGAAELRATASTLGVDLAREGLRLAVESGRPENILRWSERLRANALRTPVVRAASDPQLRAAEAELRAVERRLTRSRTDSGLTSRRTQLEAVVRSRLRLVRGTTDAALALPEPGAMARALGGRIVVEYVELGGALHALSLAHGRLALHDLRTPADSEELDWLRFSLRSVSRGRSTALANAESAAQRLDHQLVVPLRDTIGEAPIVLVPTGRLHALPWASLPSLRGRPLVVSPSLATWLALEQRRPRRTGRVTVVAGPRLRHARAEATQVAAALPGATVLTGRDATVDAVLRALDGADLAHIACHGQFRADNPLFSSLELADGPLTALELQRLRRAPRVLVLSACDLALSERHPGDELLGLSAALLAAGTRTIVASVVPVPDAAARRLMLAFHRELAAGVSPAAALALAQAGLRGSSAALAGFVCLGSG